MPESFDPSQTLDQVAVLRLVGVRGPEMEPVELSRSGGVLGRGAASEVRLADATVSRRHASISHVGGVWLLTDLGGANGTWLNDVRMESGEAAPISPGDRIGIGPWILQVGSWAPTTISMTSESKDDVSVVNVQRIDPAATGRLARHRLQLLIDCAGRINQATNTTELAAAILESVIDGTGYGRAALLRIAGTGDEVEVIGYRSKDGADPDPFSRSLVLRATEGEMVTMMAQQADAAWGQSIAELNIHSALCAPILVDEVVAACLYLDARGQEEDVQGDAAGFCEAITQLGGLCMANIRRQALKTRQRELEADLAAAKEAQQLMVPVDQTSMGHVDYHAVFHPGRAASGDLFDVLEISEDRIAVLLGDVSGKGVGAAILMAAAQAYLRGVLSRGEDPGTAVKSLNEFLIERSAVNRFVTLWVGLFDADGSVTYVDAGHGHWVVCRANGDVEVGESNAPLVGAVEGMEFTSMSLSLGHGDRIVLMTDGIPEQPGGEENEQYGINRVTQVLSRTRTCNEDVTELMTSLRRWSAGPLADDTTAASVTVNSINNSVAPV
ncbi:MAG: SpoIIE family protein phosphatase [Phycisphaerales bacterium]|nr:SpoIIE family protein phosphatase [Phycisphaerales bacterium]